MRIWFEWQHNFDDSDVWFGIGGFKHHKDHKWTGYTINLYLLKRLIQFTYVSNWTEYEKKIINNTPTKRRRRKAVED